MKIKALVFTLTLVGLSLTALAQTSRGTVSGAVADPTGAVISGDGGGRVIRYLLKLSF